MPRITLRYYASLRDQAGTDAETVDSHAADVGGLYEECVARLGLRWPRAKLRVAVNGEFADWSRPLDTGDDVVFIPPVSGG